MKLQGWGHSWMRFHTLAGQRVMIAMHHPPLDLGLPAMDAFGIMQKEALGAVIAKHAAIRHLFFGHVHRPVHGTWRGIPFSTQRALNHQVALHFAQDGTDNYSGGIPCSHEPPAYSIVLVHGDCVIIHVHDFLDASPRFDLFDKTAEGARSIDELRTKLGEDDQLPARDDTGLLEATKSM